ncbi:MAG: L-rhamnose mutarotase [Actinobacteria bacterium]|nr:L-rhamnose mutarotase [Actinomycetota bacterium]
MVCRLRLDKRAEYLELHSAVWPGVEAMITECGIRNFTIFVRGDVLFGYYEYVGDDFEADQARMAADPVSQQWWSRTDPCQFGFDDDAPDGARWQELDEVWHQD